MSSPKADLDAAVRSRFKVLDSFELPDGGAEYKVGYTEPAKAHFVELASELAKLGYAPLMSGTVEECVITARKAEPPEKRTSRVPTIFALLTVASITVFSLLQQILYEQLAPGLPGYVVFLGTGLAVAGLLAAQELARRYAARRTLAGPSAQYLIPGVPFLPPFLPALGFISLQRGPAVNRDRFFDANLLGPLALLVLAALIYALGDLTAFRSTVSLTASHLANSTVSINPSAIQFGIDRIFGGAVPSAPPGYLILSPLGDAATVGFILVFLGLLPLASFTGGQLSTAVLGPRWSRLATYLSVVLLLVVDTPNYWSVAIIVLVLAGRPTQLRVMDEVSRISSGRRWVYAGVVLLALLSLPIPHDIANFALG